MTLVLSLITSSWAIQVSDRKLVRLDAEGKVTWKNEERNKAVLWCKRLAFGYTGIAEFGPAVSPLTNGCRVSSQSGRSARSIPFRSKTP